MEALKPRYLIDAFIAAHFKVLPNINLETAPPEQKEFIMYMVAAAPTMDQISHYLRYVRACEEVDNMEFTENEDIIRLGAASQNMSVDAYKLKYNQEQRTALLKEIAIEFGYEKSEEPKDIEAKVSEINKRAKAAIDAIDNADKKRLESLKENPMLWKKEEFVEKLKRVEEQNGG